MAPISAMANAVITTLHQLGYEEACFIGSFAGALHGNPRQPKDLDILILGTNHTQEQIKHQIVNFNQSFYRVRPNKKNARFKRLFYNPSYSFNPRTIYSLEYSQSLQNSINIDIIVPPSMRIPPIPAEEIINFRLEGYSSSFPAVPLAFLITLKLHAWSKCRAEPLPWKAKRQHKHKTDIEALVSIARQNRIAANAYYGLLPQWAMTRAQRQIKEFVHAFPDTATKGMWIQMGFKLPRITTINNERGGRSF